MTPDDLLELYGGVNMLWTTIDRSDYSNVVNATEFTHSLKPVPPPYTLYTGMSLGDSFLVFLGLLALHFFCLFLVKLCTVNWRSDRFRGIFNIIICSFENMNISRPTHDWDQKKTDKFGNPVKSTIGYYKKRYNEVKIELLISYILNWIFSFVLLVPLWYTGNKMII